MLKNLKNIALSSKSGSPLSSKGLVRCGVRVAQLGTEEITELFYKLFNPGEMLRSQLK
jgi:hypothetical protein